MKAKPLKDDEIKRVLIAMSDNQEKIIEKLFQSSNRLLRLNDRMINELERQNDLANLMNFFIFLMILLLGIMVYLF